MREKHAVLIVDDEPIVRESLRDWLSDAGYQVVTAGTAEEALATIAKQDFGAMVLDVRLPGTTGLTVLNEVKTQRPWIKTIVITAYPTMETATAARKLGAVDFLVKPVVPEDLEQLLREALAGVGQEPSVAGQTVMVKPAVADTSRIKKSFSLTKKELSDIVTDLLQEMEVIGVRAKQGKYVFDSIGDFNDLSLDYDVTVMPPTRYLRPAKEALLGFTTAGSLSIKPITEAKPQAIIGVHPYDLKAIELLDEVFMSSNPDPNYTARRRNTILIGLDCLHPSPHCFAPSMGTQTAEVYDLFLTDIGGGYVATAGTAKGAHLLVKNTRAQEATSEELIRQRVVRETAWEESLLKHGLFLNVARERLPRLLEESYDDPYWESRSESCLSCGSCVMVCPTCYCFDVQDEVDLTLQQGERIRSWDGCMLTDFAAVATGENFRHDRASRLRHRIYRKGKYIMERYGKMGCVGCGRCAAACLAEIASPLEAFNAIAEVAIAKKTEAAKEVKTKTGLYTPEFAELVNVTELTPREKVFEFRLPGGRVLGHQPGQFVEVTVPAIGEAPISISSSPTRGNTFQLAIRNVGSVTQAIHNLPSGAKVGIRGPFGNGFPIEKIRGKDILFVAGGIGLFPLRSLVQYVLDKRSDFGKVVFLFGARSPAERLFLDELDAWSKRADLEFLETVDRGNDTWQGNVGVITTLIPKVQLTPRKTAAVVVGPPVMYRFVIVELKKRDLADESIYMSLERRMKCGVGKCGHCQINGVYVCQEGPVFSLAQIRNLREAV